MYLSQMIFQQKVIPGQRLVYSDLCKLFDMSRTPIINALTRLEQEGFLVSEAFRGFQVKPIDLQELWDLFGVREETIKYTPIVEFKYAQGAKPGLGGHLLGEKVTKAVAAMRETVVGSSLFSPFPFHSVYSVEDHKKHVDWMKEINNDVLVSVKVSTPTDVDMVAIGAYYAGAHIIHIDGAVFEIPEKLHLVETVLLPIQTALKTRHDIKLMQIIVQGLNGYAAFIYQAIFPDIDFTIASEPLGIPQMPF